MPFPKRYAEWAARLRIPAGFAIAAVFFFLAQPTPLSLLAGGAVSILGLSLRAWAAGHLEKNQQLTTSGPFAHVRNPLYLGTLTGGAGLAIAGAQAGIGLLLVLFFVAFYLPVVEEEERHLRTLFPGYGEYASRVPKFVPSLVPRYRGGKPFRGALYRYNREYEAFAGFLVGMTLLVGKMMLG